MLKPTTDASWEVEISGKNPLSVRWNGQNFQYYKKLVEISARKTSAELFQVMTGPGKHFSSVCTDMGQQLMDLMDGTSMWKYLCDRYEGTANEQTKAMTKRQLYAQLESAKCKQTDKVDGHLNYMCRLKGRLNTVGMTLDDARFDRLRGFVDAGMDCVNTPENVVAMAITFDKANQADSQLHRSFGNDKQTTSHKSKTRGGRGQDKGSSGPLRGSSCNTSPAYRRSIDQLVHLMRCLIANYPNLLTRAYKDRDVRLLAAPADHPYTARLTTEGNCMLSSSTICTDALGNPNSNVELKKIIGQATKGEVAVQYVHPHP
eukprot:jgi/Phyca11/115653/e_gw1.29.419.1